MKIDQNEKMKLHKRTSHYGPIHYNNKKIVKVDIKS